MISLVFFGYVVISATIVITIVNSVVNENKRRKKDLENIPMPTSIPTEINKKADIRYNVEYILNQRNNKKNKTKYYNINYDPKRYIKTNNQLKFYNVLLEVAREMDCIIFSKAILENVLNAKMPFFNKMSSKNLIFVLVRITDCKIVLCIDLNPSRRNNFIDKLFYDYNIKILEYPISRDYFKDSLKNAITVNMDD